MHAIIKTDIEFANYLSAFQHINQILLEKQIVKEGYLEALIAREQQFPTGIVLEKHAVAIPHCEATHANQPAVYLIRPNKPVAFYQADGDEMVDVSLIIALVVTEPQQQLALLRQLFSQLQDTEQVEKLLNIPAEELASEFNSMINK